MLLPDTHARPLLLLTQTRMMALTPDPNARYRSMLQAFQRIVSQEHPRALFRGIGVVAMGAGPAHALYFSCYEFSKKGLTAGGEKSSFLHQGEWRRGGRGGGEGAGLTLACLSCLQVVQGP